MGFRKSAAVSAMLVSAVAMLLSLGSCGGSGSGSAVAFTGTTLDGQPFDLAAYRGTPVVINFWASWCGYCGAEMPDVVAFAAAHPEVQVIGVDVNDQTSGAQAFVQQYGMTFPQVADPDGEVFGGFDSSGLPTTVFLDADLTVRETIIGMTDRDGLEAGLQKAL
jgi:cytochrome c biogenesis protein CcmG, thiol:disulfide interchange protein DsbE